MTVNERKIAGAIRYKVRSMNGVKYIDDTWTSELFRLEQFTKAQIKDLTKRRY